MEIIKKRMILDCFNPGSHHEITEKSYIAEEGLNYKYIDSKNIENILNIK
ncbi:hypothetical protein J7E63_21330 [Bacillus sp. ISL-75]|nr:hypothetical protein [Bacillus sp. ISL-75]MBT2729438.1 hypothetical protein [Bacillus sp. ISL-75]